MKFEKVFHKGREHFLKNHKIRSKIYSLFCRIFFIVIYRSKQILINQFISAIMHLAL